MDLVKSPGLKMSHEPSIDLPMESAVDDLTELLLKVKGRSLPKERVEDWALFHSHPYDRKMAAYGCVTAQVELLQEMASLRKFSEMAMLRVALSKLKILFDENVFSEIEDNDIIEILDENYGQVYRSMSFFDLCNYSLLDLVNYPWFELYERSTSITQALLEAGTKLFGGETSYISLATMPSYTLKELRTTDPVTFHLREKFVAKGKSVIDGRAYILSVKTAEELNDGKPMSNLKFI